jgi:hypothetical protein
LSRRTAGCRCSGVRQPADRLTGRAEVRRIYARQVAQITTALGRVQSRELELDSQRSKQIEQADEGACVFAIFKLVEVADRDPQVVCKVTLCPPRRNTDSAKESPEIPRRTSDGPLSSCRNVFCHPSPCPLPYADINIHLGYANIRILIKYVNIHSLCAERSPSLKVSATGDNRGQLAGSGSVVNLPLEQPQLRASRFRSRTAAPHLLIKGEAVDVDAGPAGSRRVSRRRNLRARTAKKHVGMTHRGEPAATFRPTPAIAPNRLEHLQTLKKYVISSLVGHRRNQFRRKP